MITAANVIKPPMWCPGRNGHELWGGCVGYWPLWESVGTNAMDLSGNGNNGTLTGMDPPTDWVVDVKGICLNFDASDDNVSVGTLPITGPPFSLYAFAAVTANADRMAVSIANGSDGYYHFLGVNQSNLRAEARTYDGTARSANSTSGSINMNI